MTIAVLPSQDRRATSNLARPTAGGSVDSGHRRVAEAISGPPEHDVVLPRTGLTWYAWTALRQTPQARG